MGASISHPGASTPQADTELVAALLASRDEDKAVLAVIDERCVFVWRASSLFSQQFQRALLCSRPWYHCF
jgi:hypothetical protein